MNVSRTGTEAQEISQSAWSEPGGTLGELVRAMAGRTEEMPKPFSGLRPSFAGALRRDFVTVIGEIKRASPSKGSIRMDLDSGAQAAVFERGGVAAISVLTEPSRFGGCLADIGNVRGASLLPILKKDFHTRPEQILQAKELGASAALLIVRAVTPDQLRECIVTANENAIDLLVEVHRESELDLALENGASIIGVNTRNLETLEMDRTAHGRLIPRIPANVIAIAESGMSTLLDVRWAADVGADAVLIGSILSETGDVATLLRAFTTVTRRTDVRKN